jgi:Tfp pilus assembly protein PilV
MHNTKMTITQTDERGFSLLELMMAVVLTVGLLAAVFSIIARNQNTFVTESGVTDMNQNVRTAADLLTQDIQAAGMGLPRGRGTFAAIFYTNGASGAPDKIMIVNGDPFAPTADVTDRAAGSAEFFCLPPPEVTVTGNGSNQSMTYLDKNGQPKPIYQSYDVQPALYICYDDTHAMVLALTQGGQIVSNGGNTRLKLQHNPSNYMNPPSVFGTTLDTAEPDYPQSKIAKLGSMLSYRVNAQTHELERTEDLSNWYVVARGILNLQFEYRTIGINNGAVVETNTSTPTDRDNIRAVVVTITAETPDLDSTTKGYRRVTHKFEVAPRNFNLLNNTNLSSNLN